MPKIIPFRKLGSGKSMTDASIYVTGLPSLKSISPSSGSVYGGTILTLTGNGFTTGTVISLHTATCTVIDAALDKLTCLTSEHADGSASLSIK
jgi:hypothetical protein